jgi:hypothetical protein
MLLRIEASLRELGEDRLPLTYNLWDMTVRQPRSTFSSPAVDRYVVEPMTPFTDSDVVDWMLQLPLRWLFGQRVYKRMVVESFPEIAQVPWARTGRPVPTSFVQDIAVLSTLFAAKRIRRAAASAGSIAVDSRLRVFENYPLERLPLDLLPADVFDRDAVLRIVRAPVSGWSSATLLLLLMTFVECARLFASGGLTAPPPETTPGLEPAGIRSP